MRRFTLALACLSLLPIAAKADTLNFNVSGTIPGFGTGTGTFTGTSNANGSYTITGITAPGYGPISVLATNNGAFTNDNLFFPTSTHLVDASGIAFSGSFGQADLYLAPTGYVIAGYDTDHDYFSTPISLTLTSTSAATVTPEPSSILLTMSGLFGTAAFFMRKRMQAVGDQAGSLA